MSLHTWGTYHRVQAFLPFTFLTDSHLCRIRHQNCLRLRCRSSYVLHAIYQELRIHATVNKISVIVTQSTDVICCEQYQHYKDCPCAYSLVVVNWRDNGVCAILVSLNFIPIMKYWMQVTWSFIPTFCNSFLNSKLSYHLTILFRFRVL